MHRSNADAAPAGPISTSPACASPSPAAPPASASPSSRASRRAARTSPSSRATRARVRARRGRAERHATASSATSPEGSHPPDRLAGPRRARRARRARQQRLRPRAGAAGAARRHRVRGLRARAGDQRARPVPADEGVARLARRVGARRARRRRCSTSRATRRSTPTRWGAYGASKAALAHMSRIWDEELAAARRRASSRSIRATWTRRCTRPRVPDADPSTLKRPRGRRARAGRAHRGEVLAQRGARHRDVERTTRVDAS